MGARTCNYLDPDQCSRGICGLKWLESEEKSMAKSVSIPVSTVRKKSIAGLGLVPLVALVVGSMIGGGVFSLPQNMAKGASPGAVIIGWLIAGVGMLALAFVYQGLSTRKPTAGRRPLFLCPGRVRRFHRIQQRVGLLAERLDRQRLLCGIDFRCPQLFCSDVWRRGQYLAGHCWRFHLPLAGPCAYPHGHPASRTRQCHYDDSKAGADLHLYRCGR